MLHDGALKAVMFCRGFLISSAYDKVISMGGGRVILEILAGVVKACLFVLCRQACVALKVGGVARA